MDVNQAVSKQLQNIQAKTGKSLDELAKVAASSGLEKHGELVAMFKRDFGLGHGDANMLTLHIRGARGAAQAEGKSESQVVDEIYAGPKAALRPIHDALMSHIQSFGEFEMAPKKGYVSLRRKKQFAMLGPATNARVELGLNVKGLPETGRLVAEKPGSMCQYKVKLTEPGEVDSELLQWVRLAYDSAR